MKQQKNSRIHIFERIGKVVNKRYKIILIVWFLLVGGSVYPAMQLFKVLSYNEIEFLPEGLEYYKGLDIYKEHFPTNATGDTIIVIESDELITSSQNLEYIETLTERINENYNESIYALQSILTLLDYYNTFYWYKLNEVGNIIYEFFLDNISNINSDLYVVTHELSNLFEVFPTIYLDSWFNFSRAFFYGHFNSTLFSTGPNAAVYQIIELFTNFTMDYSIKPVFVDNIFQTINGSFIDPGFVNDQIIHPLNLKLVNTTLYQLLSTMNGTSIQEYNQEVYPLLQLYNQNWLNAFNQNITNQGLYIINGTDIDLNSYENSSLINAYNSQLVVLDKLQYINETVFQSINITTLTIEKMINEINFDKLYEEIFKVFPISISELRSLVNPYIPLFLEEIYALGENPNTTSIEYLASRLFDRILMEMISFYPPPESIDDIPIFFTKWLLSNNGRVSLILVQYNSFNKTSEEIDTMIRIADQGIGKLAHELLEEMDLEQTRIYHTGDKFIADTWITQAQIDASRIDIFTVIFVLIILLLIFCSFVAPIIPLIAIGSSIAISMAFLWFISFAMDIHFLATLFLTVTSLGAGVDYCIFIFSRYNEERKKGTPKEQAIETAIRYAGESVFHSGLTVIVGFGALIIPDFPLLRILGITMCIGITITIISAIFVVPSIVIVLGDAVWWPKALQIILRPQNWFIGKSRRKLLRKNIKNIVEEEPVRKISRRPKGKKEKKKFLVRFANFVTKNGLTITIVSLLATGPFIYFTFTMDTSTDMLGMLPKDFEGTQGRDILSNSLSIGDPTPIRILIHNLDKNPLDYQVLLHTSRLCDELIQLSRDKDEISSITVIKTTVQPLGFKISYSNPDVISFYYEMIQPFIGNDEESLLLEIYLETNPYDSQTENFITNLPHWIDNAISSYSLTSFDNASIYFLGMAQVLYEIKKVTDNAFPIVIPIVIVGVYLVLFFLFGSYLTPLRLILTIAMSIAITLGTLYLIFSLRYDVPIFWLLPLMLFSVLMGLGLDYDIFLVTRIKEYYDKGLSNKEAIVNAIDHTATIISSCGILMATAYSTIMFSQLWHLRELGFAFSLAIILDATVIRLIIVPAIMVLLEKLNWIGPKKLMRIRHDSLANKKESEFINAPLKRKSKAK